MHKILGVTLAFLCLPFSSLMHLSSRAISMVDGQIYNKQLIQLGFATLVQLHDHGHGRSPNYVYYSEALES